MTFQEFKDIYQKVPVVEYPNKVQGEPLVSVCVQTYQHAAFIRDCLDGILMQETDFLFEVLIGEDDSSDGTREICLDYAERFPDKIRMFMHDRRNNALINGRPSGRFNFLYNIFQVRGEYVALCEGDDFWTDPLKLQIQVNFLFGNPEYSMICTDYNECDYDGTIIKKQVWGHRPSTLPNEVILRGYTPKLLTSVFHLKDFRENIPKEFINVANGDNFLFALITRKRPAFYVDKVTGCYRITRMGIWSGSGQVAKLEMQFSTFREMLNYYSKGDERRSVYFRLSKISKVLFVNSLKRMKVYNAFKYGIYYFLALIGRQIG
jgi:glycosyltransferase involved in cell wall biosynthesis